jgi:diacylglycerol O-acyltransferase / wax synthase
MARRERMSGVDTAWLRMDRPSNLMMIVAVLVLDRRPDFGRLKRTVGARLAPFRRFHQTPVLEATGGWWEDDSAFDLARHVTRARLPGARGGRELRQLVARLAAQRLDPRHPLWSFTLVENFNDGAVLVARIHHCIADGIALVRVMLSLTDDAPDAPIGRAPRRAGRRPDKEHAAGALELLVQPLAGALRGAVRLSGDALEKYLELLRDPGHVIDYARAAAQVTEDVAALATMADDSRTRFKGRPRRRKRVAWSEPLPLAEVKAVGNALGCSVNDILLASVAGSLGAYLAACGDAVTGVEVRAMVPVNLRRPGSEEQLGNRFGLVPLLLPVGLANPFERVYTVRARMEALKGSYVAPISLALLEVMGLLPRPVQQEVLDLLANKATAVMTNVPGPQQPLYLAGRRLDEIMFWVPQSGNIGMGVSILSYNGGVQFGLITDARLVPDPERIIIRFRAEFDKLLLALLMEPWDVQRDPRDIERDLAAALRAARGRVAAPSADPMSLAD